MKVLLTGATGFVGSHLTRLLVRRGDDVAALMRPCSDRRRIADVLPAVRVMSGDLQDLVESPSSLAEQIGAFTPEVVFHLAWWGVGNRFRNDPSQIGRNLEPSLALVELAARTGARLWIGLGSQAEYGPHGGAISEGAPTHPTTLYGATKLATGMLAGQLCRVRGLDFAWLRLFSVYGPDDDPSWLIPQVISALLRGDRPALTEGIQTWDYLYVGDVARALAAVADSPSARGFFNLGSGRSEAVRAIAERIRDQINPGLPLGFGEVPYRDDQIFHLEADNRRLREETGWTPETSLSEGIRETVEWFRQQQDAGRHRGTGDAGRHRGLPLRSEPRPSRP